MNDELLVFGALLQGYAQACKNLNVVAGSRAAELVAGIDVLGWYPFERIQRIEKVVLDSYEHAPAILTRVGMEMMFGWYHFGPGRGLVHSGFEFLSFQTGSNGYASVVKGPAAAIGRFELLSVDRTLGRARLFSTTPLNRDMERGVLIGGMTAPGDLDFVEVVHDPSTSTFDIEWH